MKDPDLTPSAPTGPPETAGVSTVPPLQLNPEDYREDLGDFELTQAQEDELLAVLWNIMSSFVAMGYGLDSVQLFSTTEDAAGAGKAGADSGNSLPRKDNPHNFNQTAFHGGSKEGSCQTE